MEIVVKITQLLLSLSILIILHELGHFTFAKLFKTRVEKFYLFFDPWFSLFKYKKGETEYGLGWLPLGGYVKISGMIDESMDLEQMKQPPQPWEFRSKPIWQRLLIMIGGVLVNVILAICIYSMVLFVWGEEYLPTKNATYGISCSALAKESGLHSGDKILSLDNKPIENFASIVPTIFLNDIKTIQVERDGQKLDVSLPSSTVAKLMKNYRDKKKNASYQAFIEPRFPFYIADFAKSSPAKLAGLKMNDRIIRINEKEVPYFDQFKSEIGNYVNKPIALGVIRGKDTLTVKMVVPTSGIIGVLPKIEGLFALKQLHYSFLESIPAGIKMGFKTISDYLKQFKLIFNSKTEGYKDLGGFGTILKIFPSTWDWQAFWSWTAFLSIMLAVLNILPIPGLDGGHVFFLLYELITGRKPGDKFLEYAQIVGLIIILSLFLYANGNDIYRYLIK